MKIGKVGLLVAVLTFALGGAAMAAVAAGQGGIGADQLVYQGATVETQVDVNGEAAMALVGSALDAIAAQMEEQAKAMQAEGKSPGEGPMAMLPMAAPMIGPARDAIKSLSHITVVVMKPKEAVAADQFISHYNGLMSPAGWSPFVTVKDKGGTGVYAMLAPEGKGVFFAINDKKQMVVGMVTTTKPLGDLIGKVVGASGGALPQILSSMGKGKPAPAAKSEKAESEKPESGKPEAENE